MSCHFCSHYTCRRYTFSLCSFAPSDTGGLEGAQALDRVTDALAKADSITAWDAQQIVWISSNVLVFPNADRMDREELGMFRLRFTKQNCWANSVV